MAEQLLRRRPGLAGRALRARARARRGARRRRARTRSRRRSPRARAALAARGRRARRARRAAARGRPRRPRPTIVETGALMAADPALDAALEAAVLDARPLGPAAAIADACEQHAAAIAALADPMLAARADDVRCSAAAPRGASPRPPPA